MIFQSLIDNAALLLILSYCYTLISRHWQGEELLGQVIRGLLFGGVVIGVMLSPLQLQPGLVFDTRSVVIATSGLFGGPVTALITVLISCTYRIWLGGIGVLPGVATAVVSGIIGVFFYYRRKTWVKPRSPGCFYLFGLLVHGAMILCMFTLPQEIAWQTIQKISLPVMLIYPLVTLLLATLLAEQEKHIASERIVKESEERFRTLFEQAADAIFVSDFDGNLRDANQTACTSLGYSREELLSLRVQDVDAHFPDREILQSFWRKRLDTEQATSTFESVHRRKDGTTFPVELRAGFIEYRGRRLVLGLGRDISERQGAEQERQKLEGQLLHAQKMEAIGTLAGGIAHEFNNILAAIVGYAELFLVKYDRENIAKPEYVQEIRTASKRATELVKRILAFSRKVEIAEFKVFDLNKELAHGVSMLEKTIPREIKIELDLDPEPLLVRGDPGQFEQILLNLATNAKHAMPDGGRLIITTHAISVQADGPQPMADVIPGEYVQLEIADTGSGMTPEIMKQIFDPFFTTKELGSGTGLGLAVVYGIVKGHHGYLDCSSKPGTGTNFQILFPATTESEEQTTAPQATPTPQGKNEVILLVDDEKSLLDIGQEMLVDRGYRILLAKSGEEAVELVRKQGDSIDLVILDLSMPGMGGHRCLIRLLQIKPEIKVLITSGYAVDQSIEDTLAVGARGFVAKPFGQQELLTTIHEVLYG